MDICNMHPTLYDLYAIAVSTKRWQDMQLWHVGSCRCLYRIRI